MRLRDGAVHVAGRAVPSLIALVTAMLLTWVLPPAEYGVYALGTAFVALGYAVLYEWLVSATMRCYETRDTLHAFMPTVLALAGAVLLAAALLLALAVAAGALEGHFRFACLLLFGTATYAWFELVGYVRIGRFQGGRFLAMGVLRATLVLPGSFAAAWLTGSGEAVLLAGFAASLLAAATFSRDSEFRPAARFNAGLARSLFGYGWPMGVTVTLHSLSAQGSRILVAALAGVTAAGAFAVAYTLVQTTVAVIAQGIGAAAFMHAVRAAEGGEPDALQAQLRRNGVLLLGALLPAGVGLGLTAPGLAELLADPAYHKPVAAMAPWLAAFAVLASLRGKYFDTAFQLSRRTGLLVQVTAAGTALSVCLTILLVPWFGAPGASMAMAGAGAVSLLHSALLSRRCMKLPLPWGEASRVLLATAAMAAAVLATRAAAPGALGVLAEIAAGGLTYAVVALALDVAGMRRECWRRIRSHRLATSWT